MKTARIYSVLDYSIGLIAFVMFFLALAFSFLFCIKLIVDLTHRDNLTPQQLCKREGGVYRHMNIDGENVLACEIYK